MRTCPWLYASIEARKVTTACRRTPATRTGTNAGTNADTPRRPAIAATPAGWFGWRALRDLLNAIPDSNDDFGMF
ncbi:hypothetical protein BCh11DRAFT_01594 [Burkholderia sp. Ch1-1]|uniref:hypothetical protein n=1 Tax=Paraburkholderia TaxID=1822464 RepID=UPI0001D23117|nr:MULTISPECIES: hypothetical protein [Paraburkholderia]EIF33811.1 hypothetical protein BCh11DRAFT_01594 [Burkholderia sp. Ch1-1]MDR8400900.1 hypothetical protein [Paraburkholderia sp. USG1]